MTIFYSSCFGLVSKAVMFFVVVQQTHSFTWTKQPEDATYVVEGVSSSHVRLKWSWNLLNAESISTIFVTREKPKESTGSINIASRIADNPLRVQSGFTNAYRVEDEGTLVINKVTKADADTIYTFLLTYIDGAGDANLVQSLTVIKVLVPPKITVFPKEKTEQDPGTNVTLTCTATGDPQPNITWTKDDIPVRTFNVSGPVLHLVNVQRKDAGVYKCTAFNGYGSNATAVGVVSIKCPECDAKIVGITISLIWKDAYRNRDSPEYKSLSTYVTSALWTVYARSSKPLYRIVIDEFRSGSVVAVVEFLFGKGTPDPLEPLRYEICDGKLGDIPVLNTLILNPTTPPFTAESMTSITTVTTTTPSFTAESMTSITTVTTTETKILYGIFLPIVFLLLLIIVVLSVLLWKRHRTRGEATYVNERNWNTNDGYEVEETKFNAPSTHDNTGNTLLDGDICLHLPELPTSLNYNGLDPGTRSWEVERDAVQITKVIGQGAFSQVAKAVAWNIAGIAGKTTVAVKMLKKDAPDSDRKDLLSELKLMKTLRPHPHVIKLMGCVTESDPLLVLIEYVPYGDLLGYLRKSRGLNDTYYNDPDVKPQTSLTAEQLLKFACQIADGMCYLSSKKIIHRDLAARNVLVGEGEKCKVTDFGMSGDVQQDDIYTRKSRGRLPVKWTAYEALLYGKYTTQSDVWSYGIVLYEILTVGGPPYPGISGHQIASKLQEGYRMPKPQHLDDKLYKVMIQCWQQNPNDRPTFAKLKEIMNVMERSHKTYVNLAVYNNSLYANLENLTER